MNHTLRGLMLTTDRRPPAMAAEGVLQGRCRPGRRPPRRSTEQARPQAPAHLQDLGSNPALTEGSPSSSPPAHPPQKLHQPSPHLLRRQPLLVLEDTGHALDPFVGLRTAGHRAAVSSSPPAATAAADSNPRASLPPGTPHGPSWRRSGSADRATSARRPPAAAAHRRQGGAHPAQ